MGSFSVNKVHPIFIILLLLVVIISLHVKKNSLEKTLEADTRFLAQLEVELKDINELKTKWTDSQKKLNTLLKNPSFEGMTIKHEDLKDRALCNIENITPTELKLFTNKLLNSYIVIKKLSIQREDMQISIIVEIEK